MTEHLIGVGSFSATLPGSIRDIVMGKAAIGGQPLWISKGRVNRAGEAVRAAVYGKKKLDEEDTIVLEAWRSGHAYVLNTFQAVLRNRTKGKKIAVAQRLKRRTTIVDKLIRLPNMELARMDDLAGCRVIFSDVDQLRDFRSKLHKARFKHKLRNPVDKYDYINTPKASGYRGIHDIFDYESKDEVGAPYKGLLLELQYRTECQHAWATSSELITQFTGAEPKFDRGDNNTKDFFKLASEVIARTKEGMKSCYSQLADGEVAELLLAIDHETGIMKFFRESMAANTDSPDEKQLILHLDRGGDLKISDYPTDSAAVEAYFQMEKDYPDDNLVLVKGETFQEIRNAYRNYFSDPEAFVRYIDEGVKALKSS